MVSKKGNSRADFENNSGMLLKSTRSQVTIFIIIAVLLVVAIGIVFVVRNALKTGEVTPPAGAENVGDFVTNCLKTTSENGLVLIGRQGGYYKFTNEPHYSYSGNDSETDKYFTELGSITIPYYGDGSSSAASGMPSDRGVIETQLSLYIKDNIDKCLNNFSIFKQKGFEVQNGTMEVSARILDEKVIVILDYPVTTTKADFTQKKTVYSVDVPTRLKMFYDRTVSIIGTRNDYPLFILLNDGVQLSSAFDIFNSVNGVGTPQLVGYKSAIIIPSERTLIFILTDNDYKLNNAYNDWVFAYKY